MRELKRIPYKGGNRMKYKRRKKHSNMFQYRNKKQSWYGSTEQERYVADQLKELTGREPDPEEVKKVIHK